jgi:hypothetical protein
LATPNKSSKPSAACKFLRKSPSPKDKDPLSPPFAAAKALVTHSNLPTKQIVEEALKIAGQICIYTNTNIKVEAL